MKAIQEFLSGSSSSTSTTMIIVLALVLVWGTLCFIGPRLIVRRYQEDRLDGNGEPKEYEVVKKAKAIYAVSSILFAVAGILIFLVALRALA